LEKRKENKATGGEGHITVNELNRKDYRHMSFIRFRKVKE